METIGIADYAAVVAALAENFTLDEVLAARAIDAEAWQDAETSWLVEIGKKPDVLADYQGELARAEDALARAVPPIDEDALSWLAFLRVYAAESDAFAWLAGQELGQNDVSRLTRRWALRFAEPALVAKLPALRKQAEGAPLPRVRPAKRPELAKVFAPKAIAEASVARGVTGRLDAMAFAALEAALETAPAERARLLRERGLGEETFEGLESGYAARLAVDAELRRDVELLKAHYRERARRAATSPVERVVDPPTVDQLEATLDRVLDSRTLEAVAGLVANVWPFSGGPSGLPKDDDESVDERPARDGTTAEEPGGVLRDPLPFAATKPAKPRLTLRQHASLTVEIGLGREPVLAILARYQVTAAEKSALDVQLAAAMQRDPSTREAWREACAVYLSWLSGVPMK